jgi:hypothetical protein
MTIASASDFAAAGSSPRFCSCRLKFRIYWTLIGFFSGLIRLEMLRLVKRCAEANQN